MKNNLLILDTEKSKNTEVLEDRVPIEKPLLKEHVEMAVKGYLDNLGDTPAANLLELVIGEIEPPLIKAVLLKTHFNRLQAAKILGISRTTFHKKLNIYKLDEWIQTSKRSMTAGAMLYSKIQVEKE